MRSAAWALMILGAMVGCARRLEAAGLCAGAVDVRIVVDTTRHALALCERGQETGLFDVRLGRGGVGKRAEGDGKTPIGTYSLGEPRQSKRFGMFIPIGYPTAEQRRQGYTGSDVGVHGPHRWVRWLGPLVNTFDSSDGCVGVAADAEIEAISAWVKKAQARTIEVR